MTSNRPTLKTISELSGFAVPTVSRALKDAPDIGQSTKETVRRIAAEIGYVPNRAGVRLRTGKTNVVSLVLTTDHAVIDDHTGRMISSISKVLRNTPYHMTITPYTAEESKLDPIRYVVETRSADAIILSEIEPEDERVAYLMERGFPFVTYGRTRWCREHPYFDFDNGSFGEMAGRRLAQKGRRHILLLAPPEGQSYRQHMIDGLIAGTKNTGANLEILDGATSQDDNPKIRAIVSQRLQRAEPVDAIVTPSNRAAISSVAALEHHGLAVGRDVDIFAKEAATFLRLFRQEIMTVHEDVVAAGEFLAEAAVRAIDQPELPPMQALALAREPRPMDSLF